MEEIIEYCLVGIITLIGLFMFLFPKLNLKPEMRSSEENISKIKRNGLILAIVGAVVLAVLVYAKSQLK